MAEYLPIRFCSDIRNDYFLGLADSEAVFNHIATTDGLESALAYHALGIANTAEGRIKFKNVIQAVRKLICEVGDTHITNDFSDDDIKLYLMNVFTADRWRKNKISYKIDSELVKQFCEMELPKDIISDYVTKFPANTFYIDVSDCGDIFTKNLHGMFVTVDYIQGYAILRLQLLIPKGYDIGIMIEQIAIPADSDKVQLSPEIRQNGKTGVELEYNALYKFLLNFFIYLHAANKDVEVSERTRTHHEQKSTSVIKDKFRELKEFEVGVRYGNTIRSNRVKYKYVGGEPKATDEKRKVSSHYRTAHWHRYWTGSGENKTLITKWIEGVFVRGAINNDDVVIHKVKK